MVAVGLNPEGNKPIMPPAEDESLKILVVVAHPHDVCHMGGTCAHHVDRGDGVSVVAITGGQRTHNEKLADELRKPSDRRDRNVIHGSQEDYAKRKTEEFARACAVFGITDVTVLPFSDHPLEATEDVVSALADILYSVRPQMILTHAPYTLPDRRFHYAWVNDHTAAGIAVQKALNHASIPDTKLGRAPHRVAAIYYTGIDYGFHEVDVCIDISDQVQKRIKAEELFESQGHTAEFAIKRIESSAGFQGWKAGTGYAETFIRGYREISRHLSVTKENLLLAGSSHEERLSWITGGSPKQEEVQRRRE